jgi:hypothetical protein
VFASVTTEVSAMRRALTQPARFALPAVVAAALLLLPTPARAEGGSTAGKARAQKLIEEQKSVIGRFMHPTSRLSKIVCTKTKDFDTGEFCLVYAFYFDGDKFNSSLRFKFFEDGSLDTIDVAGTTTWIKPFQAADMVVNALAQTVPQVGERVMALLKDGATKTALEFWLRSR